MGESKVKQKLSYEQLNKAAGDLYQQNQQLIAKLHQMEAALDDSEFNRMSFLISMLFKVVEHKEAYTPEFVVWSVGTIESSLTAFAAGFFEKENADQKASVDPEGNNSEKNEA